MTIRAKSVDRLQAANLAHRYLRLVVKHAGPIQSKLGEAFMYNGVGGRIQVKKRTRKSAIPSDDVELIENDLANELAVFNQADNFLAGGRMGLQLQCPAQAANGECWVSMARIHGGSP